MKQWKFYEILEKVIRDVNEYYYITMGDCNAKVGVEEVSYGVIEKKTV